MPLELSALRCDADTLACIAGAIAEAYYGGVPPAIQSEVLGRLDDTLRGELGEFAAAYSLRWADPDS